MVRRAMLVYGRPGVRIAAAPATDIVKAEARTKPLILDIRLVSAQNNNPTTDGTARYLK